MNSSNCNLIGNENPDPAVLAVDVFLIYEDLSTGLRARQAFEGAACQLDTPADFKVDLWRFDLLSAPELWEATLNQAASAGLLVISAHGRTQLPASVEGWLRHWLERKNDQPCALVLSLDHEVEGSQPANRILDFFRGLARHDAVVVFEHFGHAAEPASDLTVETLQYRADTKTAILDGILRRPSTPSHWGINE